MSKKERDWFRVLERVKKKEITLRQATQVFACVIEVQLAVKVASDLHLLGSGRLVWCTRSFHKGPCRQKRKHQPEANLDTFRRQLRITLGVVPLGPSYDAANPESKRLQSDSYR